MHSSQTPNPKPQTPRDTCTKENRKEAKSIKDMQFQTRLRAPLPESVTNAWLSSDSRTLATLSGGSHLTVYKALPSIESDQFTDTGDLANVEFQKSKEQDLKCGRVIALIETPFGVEKGFVVVSNERALLLLDAEFNVVFMNEELVQPDDLCFFTSVAVRRTENNQFEGRKL